MSKIGVVYPDAVERRSLYSFSESHVVSSGKDEPMGGLLRLGPWPGEHEIWAWIRNAGIKAITQRPTWSGVRGIFPQEIDWDAAGARQGMVLNWERRQKLGFEGYDTEIKKGLSYRIRC